MKVAQRKILLVDDNQDARAMMIMWLGDADYTVTTAETMAQGWKLAQSTSFDLCLLDSWLPDGSGYDLCRQISALLPDMPIVFYSAGAYEKDRQCGLAAGARAYLVKPNDLDRIEAVIRNLIAEGIAPLS